MMLQVHILFCLSDLTCNSLFYGMVAIFIRTLTLLPPPLPCLYLVQSYLSTLTQCHHDDVAHVHTALACQTPPVTHGCSVWWPSLHTHTPPPLPSPPPPRHALYHIHFYISPLTQYCHSDVAGVCTALPCQTPPAGLVAIFTHTPFLHSPPPLLSSHHHLPRLPIYILTYTHSHDIVMMMSRVRIPFCLLGPSSHSCCSDRWRCVRTFPLFISLLQPAPPPLPHHPNPLKILTLHTFLFFFDVGLFLLFAHYW